MRNQYILTRKAKINKQIKQIGTIIWEDREKGEFHV